MWSSGSLCLLSLHLGSKMSPCIHLLWAVCPASVLWSLLPGWECCLSKDSESHTFVFVKDTAHLSSSFCALLTTTSTWDSKLDNKCRVVNKQSSGLAIVQHTVELEESNSLSAISSPCFKKVYGSQDGLLINTSVLQSHSTWSCEGENILCLSEES